MKVYILLRIYLIDFDYGEEIVSVHGTFEKARQSAGKRITWFRYDGYGKGVRKYIIKLKTVN